ncbi:MAG: hypothetical protein QM270_07300 [Bacillota bacterium]|nr:hypothetical protein [Bacillota bacterium]
MRFADLAKNADKTSWSSRIEGSGQTIIYFSLIGYACAGRPTQLQFFPPDADPDTAEPEFARDFELLIPQTDVNIGFGAPTLDQLAESSEGQTTNHSIVITELNFPDWFDNKAELAAQETEEWNNKRLGKPFYEGSFEITKIDDTHGRISIRLLPQHYDFEYSAEDGQIVCIGEHIVD